VPDWHPVQTIVPIEFHFPRPGTKEPFAIIRWVNVTLDGERVSRWRAVTHAEPRRLIDAGYYAELEDAARACHRLAIAGAVPTALNLQRR
jgi:hypothetical protein